MCVCAPGGQLQEAYFGGHSLSGLSVVLVTDAAPTPWSAVRLVRLHDGEVVHKVFSTQALNTSLLAAMFGPNATVLGQRTWSAYPR